MTTDGDMNLRHSSDPSLKKAHPVFWYTKSQAIILLCVFFLVVQTISPLIPPFQSPDEFNHLKRAYLLSKGEVFLHSEKGRTGGRIDSGLLSYMDHYDELPLHYEKKETALNRLSSTELTWSGTRVFSGLPNTAVYFPLLYLPQATALAVGENFGLSIRDTYYLARSLSLLAVLSLLFGALLIYPVPLAVIALFITPMTIFQLSSASLDSVTFAMSAVIGALFMRASNRNHSFPPVMHGFLASCIFLLATARIALVALVVLPGVLYFIRRSRTYLAVSAVLLFLSVAWITWALHSVQGMFSGTPTTTDIIRYYIGHPFAFLRVLFNTVSDGPTLKGYWTTFIGVLGWLDTPLDMAVYWTFCVLLLGLALISARVDISTLVRLPTASLIGAVGASMLLVFIIELVVLTPHPAKTIEGVQGRYFTPLLILLSYAVLDRPLSGLWRHAALVLVFIMSAISLTSTPPKLLNRYWMSDLKGGVTASTSDLPTTDHP